MASEQASVIEVPTDYQQDDQRRRAIIARAAELMKMTELGA
ncbi:MAG: hypothetical protein U0670_17985 [Anaerolineae bacterium]